MKKKTEIVSLRKGTSEIELNYADLRKAVLVLRAVNHKLRQRVIDLLEEHATMTVTDIYIKPVSYTHLDVYKRQLLNIISQVAVVSNLSNIKTVSVCISPTTSGLSLKRALAGQCLMAVAFNLMSH